MTDGLLMTASDAARRLGVDRGTFARWAKRAGIEPVEMPGSTRKRYRREDVDRLAGR